MATVTPIPRSRGSLCGLVLIVLGGWAGIAPFVGPSLHFGFTPDVAWKLTDGRLYLSALPGGIALVAGLLIVATRSRGFAGFCAFVAAAAGGWLVAGQSVIAMLPASTAAQITVGGPLLPASTAKIELAQLSFFGGVGALIVFVAAIALGRFSIVPYNDVMRYGTDVTAATGPLAFDPFASSGARAAPFTQ